MYFTILNKIKLEILFYFFSDTLAFTDGDPPLDLIYRGMFRIEAGDAYDGALLADPSSPAYVRKARHYKELLNMVMRRSPLRVSFLETHILALDG